MYEGGAPNESSSQQLILASKQPSIREKSKSLRSFQHFSKALSSSAASQQQYTTEMKRRKKKPNKQKNSPVDRGNPRRTQTFSRKTPHKLLNVQICLMSTPTVRRHPAAAKKRGTNTKTASLGTVVPVAVGGATAKAALSSCVPAVNNNSNNNIAFNVIISGLLN